MTNWDIQEVTGPERLHIAGLEETRLLGVTVPADQGEAAVAYPQHGIAGKRLAATVAAGQDLERRPLVVVTLPEGPSVNAGLIQRRLATPWKTQAPWQQWVAVPAASGQ